MATPVVFNAVNYSIPAFGDVGYAQGPGNLSSYLIAIASGTLQPTGGLFSLTADANFGPNFGLVALYYKTTTANIATAGQFRLAKTDTIDWRNNANTLNLPLGINGSDQLTFNGNIISAFGNPLPIANGGTNSSTALNNNRFIISSAGKIVETAAIAASQVVVTDANGLPIGTAQVSIANGGTNSGTALVNNRIIQSSGGKIVEASAITANRALTSDANGIPIAAPSGVTDTQLGFLLNLFKYRRPCLVYSSSTVVTVETGIVTGTAGDATILFPDGSLRTETSSTRYNMTTSQNAVFTNATLGNNQGGIRSGAVANNTWYALYAVKVTTFAANWVTVADTVLPIVANFATLNSNFGTNSWIYLGLVRYGDNVTNTGILQFVQNGNMTILYSNNNMGTGRNNPGIKLSTGTATSIIYTYSAGTGATNIPNNIGFAYFNYGSTPVATRELMITDSTINILSGSSPYHFSFTSQQVVCGGSLWLPAVQGAGMGNSGGATPTMSISIFGWTDYALGVGVNPLT